MRSRLRSGTAFLWEDRMINEGIIVNIGVIFAGGVGTRMRSKDIPKQFLKVHDKPIIIHTL